MHFILVFFPVWPVSRRTNHLHDSAVMNGRHFILFIPKWPAMVAILAHFYIHKTLVEWSIWSAWYKYVEWIAGPASGAHCTGQACHRMHVAHTPRSSHSIILAMPDDIVVDEHVSIFSRCVSFQHCVCVTAAAIECRTKCEEWMQKGWKSHCLECELCLLLVSYAVCPAIVFRSSVSNHIEIDRPALDVSCTPCSAFTKNWLNDCACDSGSFDRLSRALARLLRRCFISFCSCFFFRFPRSMALHSLWSSIQSTYCQFFFSLSLHSRSNGRFAYASGIIYWLLMSNGYLFIVTLMNYSRCLLCVRFARAIALGLNFLFAVVVFDGFVSFIFCIIVITTY